MLIGGLKRAFRIGRGPVVLILGVRRDVRAAAAVDCRFAVLNVDLAAESIELHFESLFSPGSGPSA